MIINLPFITESRISRKTYPRDYWSWAKDWNLFLWL